jgi:hypothetical protein
MDILKKVKSYFDTNYSELQTIVENLSFINTNSKYPNSVVIRFGENKIIGEISVWEFEKQKYIEVEYANLIKPENEPILFKKEIKSETIIETLKSIFEELRKANE